MFIWIVSNHKKDKNLPFSQLPYAKEDGCELPLVPYDFKDRKILSLTKGVNKLHAVLK